MCSCHTAGWDRPALWEQSPLSPESSPIATSQRPGSSVIYPWTFPVEGWENAQEPWSSSQDIPVPCARSPQATAPFRLLSAGIFAKTSLWIQCSLPFYHCTSDFFPPRPLDGRDP